MILVSLRVKMFFVASKHVPKLIASEMYNTAKHNYYTSQRLSRPFVSAVHGLETLCVSLDLPFAGFIALVIVFTLTTYF